MGSHMSFLGDVSVVTEVQIKFITKRIFPGIPGVLSMGFVILEGLYTAIWGEFHVRGIDCFQMLRMRQQKRVLYVKSF